MEDSKDTNYSSYQKLEQSEDQNYASSASGSDLRITPEERLFLTDMIEGSLKQRNKLSRGLIIILVFGFLMLSTLLLLITINNHKINPAEPIVVIMSFYVFFGLLIWYTKKAHPNSINSLEKKEASGSLIVKSYPGRPPAIIIKVDGLKINYVGYDGLLAQRIAFNLYLLLKPYANKSIVMQYIEVNKKFMFPSTFILPDKKFNVVENMNNLQSSDLNPNYTFY